MGLLTRDQAERLVADCRAAESLGAGDSVGHMAVQRELLSEADRQEVARRVESAMRQREEVGGFEILARIGRGGAPSRPSKARARTRSNRVRSSS